MSLKRILWILPLLFASHAFAVTNWFVNKTTGSNDTNCNGKSNTPYVSGTAQSCPFSHPFYLLNSSGAWIIAGGDIVNFTDTGSSATYFIGEQNAGVGTDWHTRMSGICPAANNTGSGAGFDCTFPAPPSGTSGAHTQIIGQNAGSCHDSSHTHLVNPTVLSGIGNVFSVLVLSGTNFVDVSCIEVTQAAKCTAAPGTGTLVQCTNRANDTMNFVGGGGGAGIIFNNLGLAAQQFGPTNLTMTDVAVVGISSSGILGANINHLSSVGTSAFTDIYILGNGLAGWNGDGECGNSPPQSNDCENVGTVNRSHLIIDWNGCVPGTMPYDMTKADTANGFDWCQDSNGGGYGDGYVQIASGNETSNVDHSFFRWNTQDGFDGLHLSDDTTHNPNINVTNSWSEGNMGATFKIGGTTSSTAIGNVSIGNCHVMEVASNFPLNPTGWNSNLTQFCRANGDQWSFQLNNNSVVTLQNNTSVGYGNIMYDLECNAAQTSCGAGGAKVHFINNINKGYPDSDNGNKLATGIYMGPTGSGTSGVTYAVWSGGGNNNNLWNTMDTSTGCPDSQIQSPTPTSSQCSDPLLVAESNINAINPNLTSSSPAIGHGVFVSGYTTDYNGATVANPPQIGAFSFAGGTPTAATPTFSPVAGTYGSTQSVTISTSSGTVICFNATGSPATNGTTGCTTGTLYTTPVSVSTSETLFAVAGGTGFLDSSVGSAAYTITVPTVDPPSASPVAGTYVGTQTITLSTSTTGATICFTTNGTTPAATTPGTCSTGTTYTTPFAVSSTATVQALGTKAGDVNSSVASFAYTINPVSTPFSSPGAGTYSGTQSVTLHTATPGATLCYTTNGTTPAATTPGTCSTGTTYSTAISVATSETIMVIGTLAGAVNSSVFSAAYVINTGPIPNMTLGGGLHIGGPQTNQ